MIQIKKTILTLVALLAVTTGAWADETPLVTINSTGYTTFTSGSKTFDDKVTVTFSNSVSNDGDHWGWYADDTSSLLTVAGINGYTITSCKFYTFEGTAKTGYTVAGESPSVYLNNDYVYTDDSKSENIGKFGISKIEVYGGVAAASSGPEVAWNAAENSGSFKMPGGNVTLEPEYYPQAVLAAAPTAINDVPATTDGAIVNAGTVANIGETTKAQGTVMYYVSPSALDDAALLALAADQWTADVPTAADLAQGPAYVYYYVRGNDSDTDEENFSDGDILAANAVQVTIAAEPTYAVTFADDTAEPTLWTADPNAGVKKGQTVTVTYTGSKKVIGVKAEKKATTTTPTLNITSPEVGQVIGSDGKNYAYGSLPTGVTAVAKICYVSGSNGLALALTDEEGKMNCSTAQTTCAAHTPAITGGTWKLATKDEWDNMISTAGSHNELRDGFSSVGGTNMQEGNYWSSTGSGSDDAFYYDFEDGGWYNGGQGSSRYVRACLAF